MAGVSPLNKDGYISSPQGVRGKPSTYGSSEHKGIDITLPSPPRDDVTISSTHDAVVEAIDFWDTGGICVTTKTPVYGSDGKTIIDYEYRRYMHLSDTNVKVGQSLSAGETLGIMGNTGGASNYNPSDRDSTHLHYEVFTLHPPLSKFTNNGYADTRIYKDAAEDIGASSGNTGTTIPGNGKSSSEINNLESTLAEECPEALTKAWVGKNGTFPGLDTSEMPEPSIANGVWVTEDQELYIDKSLYANGTTRKDFNYDWRNCIVRDSSGNILSTKGEALKVDSNIKAGYNVDPDTGEVVVKPNSSGNISKVPTGGGGGKFTGSSTHKTSGGSTTGGGGGKFTSAVNVNPTSVPKTLPSQEIENVTMERVNHKLGYNTVVYLSDFIPKVNSETGEMDGSFSNKILDKSYVSNFYRNSNMLPTDREFLELGYTYIFMTKPNLHIYPDAGDEGAINLNGSDSFSTFIESNYSYITDSLTNTNAIGQANLIPVFIPLITNNLINFSGIDDIATSDINIGETKRGLTQKLPGTSYPNRAGGTINITYKELNPPLITYLHKYWFEYCENIKYGFRTPSARTRQRKEIDYTSSIYYFLVGPDGETLQFWGRFVGVVPQAIPYSSFVSNPGEKNVGQVSVPYIYSYKEFLELQILQDFNDISNNNVDIYTNGNDEENSKLGELQAKTISEFAGPGVVSSEAYSHIASYREQNQIPTNLAIPEQYMYSARYANIEEPLYFSKPQIIRDINKGSDVKFKLILS